MWGKDPVNFFIGWAENQENPLLVLVMIDGGGSFEQGSEVTAGPAARAILEAHHGIESSSSSSSSSNSSSSEENPQEDDPEQTGRIAGRPPEYATAG